MKRKDDSVRKDFGAVCELHIQLVEHLASLDSQRYELKKEEKAEFKKGFQEYLGNREAIILVYEENGKVVGYTMGRIKKSVSFLKEPKYGYWHEIVVDRKQRRKGIGSALAKELCKFFEKKKIKYVEGYVDNRNTLSMQTWLKNGFTQNLSVVGKIL